MATKETMEFLDGVKLVGVTGKGVFKDGKVSLDDLPAAMALLQEFGKLNDAVVGADQILEELKGVTVEEAQAVVAKVFEVVQAIKGA